MLAEARGSSLCGCTGTQAGDTPSQAQVSPEPPPLGFLQEEPGASATAAALEEEHEEPQQADEGEEERGREKVRGPLPGLMGPWACTEAAGHQAWAQRRAPLPRVPPCGGDRLTGLRRRACAAGVFATLTAW